MRIQRLLVAASVFSTLAFAHLSRPTAADVFEDLTQVKIAQHSDVVCESTLNARRLTGEVGR